MNSIIQTNVIQAPSVKLPWEDPLMTVERPLEARAQGEGPHNEEDWALQTLLGPLSSSGGSGYCG